MSSHRYDPEFASAAAAFLSNKPPVLTTAQEIRNMNAQFLPKIMAAMPPAPDITQKTFTIPSHDNTPIQLTRFTSPSALTSPHPSPAILFIHGGAMISGSVALYTPQIAHLATRTSLPIFAIDYRLAPENPAPAAVEDCYAALAWLSAHAGDHLLHVDPAKLVVMGDSAGGLLSASTALVARDRALTPPLAKQVLVYPALDDRVVFPAEGDAREEFLLWRPEWHRVVWKAYLGDEQAGEEGAEVLRNVAPQRVEDLSGLPSTYIDVGTLDMFMDEGVRYAQRLVLAGVEVELHVMPGLPHGWEMAGNITWFERMMQLRVDAIKRIQ